MKNQPVLLEVKDLQTHIALDEGLVRAVDGASFSLKRGQTLGVVGESGCGKSMTARSILRLLQRPARIVGGQILYHRPGRPGAEARAAEPIDLAALPAQSREIRSIRGAEIAMIFQEPMTSLSPVHTIGNQIMEAVLMHSSVAKATARSQAIEMLGRVGMPARTVDRYPHQISGGMRQRAMIAMALACRPNLLIADEPTTALDVTTEAQILQLLRSLQRDMGMAIMFITHSLGVVAQMTEQVIVMYMGQVVEATDVDTLFHRPKHPYTRALLRSIPRLERRTGQPLASIRGAVPHPYAVPRGCPFHTRCPDKIAGVCDRQAPPMVEVESGHSVRCVLYTKG